MRRHGWTVATAVVTVAVLVLTLSCGRSSRPSPLTGAAGAAQAWTTADLVAAGIVLVNDDRAAPERQGVVLSKVQAERLLTEQSLGAGLLGRDIDALAPMGEGMPPTSFLLSAWALVGTSPAARLARATLGEQDFTRAPDLVFPTAMLTLFAADLAREVSALGDPPGSGTGGTAGGLRGEEAAPRMAPVAHVVPAVTTTPCTMATAFLAASIKGIFDALKLTVPPPGGFFDGIVAALATVWNTAVELARGVVQATVTAITAPVFEVIRTVAAGLGAASLLLAYLKGVTLIVEPDPTSVYRLAVGSEPDVRGRFVARAEDLSSTWPPALVDCMKAAGAQMPQLMLPGAKASWLLADSPGRPGLVIPGAMVSAVQADHRAFLDFVTDRESEEQSKGPAREDGPIVTVQVEQKAVTDFLRRAEQDVTSRLKNAVLSLLPLAPVRDAVGAVIDAVLGPVSAQIRTELDGHVGSVFALRGQGLVRVVYHDPPPPSALPAAPASPAPKKGDFCRDFEEMVRWGKANAGNPTMEKWGQGMAARASALRPSAPTPALAKDVDAYFDVYTLVGAGVNAAYLGAAVEKRDLPGAARRIARHCGFSPSSIGIN